jgi:signal recognition particle receptor subunit beta
MALFNYATKEITLKVVYYGPGLSGKTTNLQYLHSVLNPSTKGKLLSLSTEADRTLFFDFLPVELGKIRDFSIRFQLYTVPGQVRYNATRKVVLKGADAVVFVADSQREMREQNIESFTNMRDNLYSNNINPDDIPIILQYNKRDLNNISSSDELDRDLNQNNYPIIESVAISGRGVEDSFNLITRLLLKHISKKHKIEIKSAEAGEEVKIEEIAAPETAHEALSRLRQEAEKQMDTHRPEKETYVSVEEEREPAGAREGREEPVLPLEKIERPAKTVAQESNQPPVMPTERIDEVIHEIRQMNQTLSEIQKSLSGLSDQVKGIERVTHAQETANSVLRGIATLLEDMKAKQGKFRFW